MLRTDELLLWIDVWTAVRTALLVAWTDDTFALMSARTEERFPVAFAELMIA